jgi:branched-chain amino acid transport system ATP-binding protein
LSTIAVVTALTCGQGVSQGPCRARLKESGLTIVLAEQNVRFVSGLGDRVYILEKGTSRSQGTMAAFLADEAVRQAYLAV